MTKALARRVVETFATDSPVLPLFLIIVLGGAILFVAERQYLPASATTVAWPQLWGP